MIGEPSELTLVCRSRPPAVTLYATFCSSTSVSSRNPPSTASTAAQLYLLPLSAQSALITKHLADTYIYIRFR